MKKRIQKLGCAVLSFAMVFTGMCWPSGEKVYAADTAWQDDYNIVSKTTGDTIKDKNGEEVKRTITIGDYKGGTGPDVDLVIPEKATIDGVEYVTVLDGSVSQFASTAKEFKSITISDGVLLRDGTSLFKDVYATTWDVSKLYTGNATTFTRMFEGGNAYVNGAIDCSTWDVKKVTDTSKMFYGWNGTSVNVANWNVAELVNASEMFYGNENLDKVDVSTWTNGSKIQNANKFVCNNTFSKLKAIDLSGIDFTTGSSKSGSVVLETSENAAPYSDVLHSIVMPKLAAGTGTFTVTLEQEKLDGATPVYKHTLIDYTPMKTNKDGYGTAIAGGGSSTFNLAPGMSGVNMVYKSDHDAGDNKVANSTGHVCDLCGFKYDTFPIIKYYTPNGATLLNTEYVTGATPAYVDPNYSVWLDESGNDASVTIFNNLQLNKEYKVYGDEQAGVHGAPVSLSISTPTIQVAAGSPLSKSDITAVVTYADGVSANTAAWSSNYDASNKTLGDRGVLFYLTSNPAIYTYKTVTVVAATDTPSGTDTDETVFGDITGIVKDINGVLIEDAVAILTDNSTSSIVSQKLTDNTGKFVMQYIPAGVYSIQIMINDATAVTGTVEIKNESTKFNLVDTSSGFDITSTNTGNSLYLNVSTPDIKTFNKNNTQTENTTEGNKNNNEVVEGSNTENSGEEVEENTEEETEEGTEEETELEYEDEDDEDDENLASVADDENYDGDESYDDEVLSSTESASGTEESEKVKAPKTGDSNFLCVLMWLFNKL